jgi:hypothetical protein
MHVYASTVACNQFLIQFIKPEALSSTDLWQDNVDEEDFVVAIEKSVALRREANDLASPIRALLGAKKISEGIDDSKYPLMKKKGINLRDNMEIQALLCELVMLNNEVESVWGLRVLGIQRCAADTTKSTEKISKGSICQECNPDFLN